MEAYQGYFENGRFIPEDHAVIPERKKVIITVLDESAVESRVQRQKKMMNEVWEDLGKCNPLPPEFDEILNQRVSIDRELDL